MRVFVKGKAWSIVSTPSITSFIQLDGARHQLPICGLIRSLSITSASIAAGYMPLRL